MGRVKLDTTINNQNKLTIGQALDERNKILLKILWRVIVGHNAKRLDRLLANKSLLHERQSLERSQQDMSVLGPTHQLGELAELFGQSHQHLVVIVERVGQEWNQLGASTLHAQRQRNRREFADRV